MYVLSFSPTDVTTSKKNTAACFSPRHDTIRINETVYASMFPEEQHITVRQKEKLPPRMFQFKTA